jgi:hypothetical protein
MDGKLLRLCRGWIVKRSAKFAGIRVNEAEGN